MNRSEGSNVLSQRQKLGLKNGVLSQENILSRGRRILRSGFGVLSQSGDNLKVLSQQISMT